MGRVDGKVAIVTGGALGIGRATAMLLAKEGAKVAITDVLDREGQEVAEKQCEGTARYWHLDVAQEDQVKTVLNEVVAAFGTVDILVNNAGISGANKPTHEVTEDEWDQLMAINVKGVFFCTKHVVPHMMKARRGSIVNVSSIYGIISAPDIPPYHASKGAVRMMTKTDALFYATYGIRVNSIHPGFIWTPMVEHYLRTQGDLEEGRRKLAALHPIGRVGDPDDIAYGILYLGSDEAKFVTGTELIIDGGYTAQ